MTRDIRDAWRQLRRRPGLTVVVLLTLAVGTGANTAFVSLLNALLLRPLAVPAASQLVSVTESETNGQRHSFTPAIVRALVDRQGVFAATSGYVGGGPVRLAVGSDEFSGAWEVAGQGFFETLGLHPAMGRFFDPADEGRAVAIVTDRFWRRHLQGDPSAIGRRISLEGTLVSIIGVVPEPYAGLQLESRADVAILASTFNLIEGRSSDPVLYGSLIGRLRSEATIDAARANLAAIWPDVTAAAIPPDIAASQRTSYLTRRLDVETARNGFSFLRTRYSGSLGLLVGLTVWMLVVAAINLAGALLAGAAGREAEFRVRVALGASRVALVRQMLAEGAMLAVLGTLAGLPLVAVGTPRLLSLLWPSDVPMPISLAPDWRVFAISIATLAVITLAAGLAPAWMVSRPRPTALMAGNRTVARSTSRWERVLLVVEVALSLVMLVGAGLSVRTLVNLRGTPLGFDPAGVLSVSLSPRPGTPSDPNDILHARELAESLAGLPGINGVGFIDHGLMLGVDNQSRKRVAPASVSPSDADPTVMVEEVSPGFFRSLSIPIEAGRDLAWRDDARTPRVAVVTATAAAGLFPGEEAVGRRIRIGTAAADQGVTIVGVVADSRVEDLHVPHPAVVFLSLGQQPGRLAWSFMQVRVSGDSVAAMSAVRARVASMGHQSVESMHRNADTIDVALARERLAAMLGVLFASLGIGLVAIGSNGLFSHWVAQRTRELGVRMALGASSRDLRRWVFQQSVGLAVTGVGVGVPAAVGVVRLAGASTYLFGLSAHDPLVLICSTVLIVLAVVAAVVGPASRVFRLDPLAALRSD